MIDLYPTATEPTFKEITGKPGYRVSDTGVVQSDLVKGTRTGRRTGVWKDLKPFFDRHGRNYANLGGKNHFVHRLVLEAFDGPCPPGMECLHCDGNCRNNNIKNLRWGTRDENVGDGMLHGTIPSGERHWNSKLSDQEVKEIRALRASGWKTTTLAATYNVGRRCISKIVNNQRRKPVEA